MNEEYGIDELAPWLVIVITLIGGGLRVFWLGNISIRWEEAFSVWMANHSITDMLQWIVRIDQNPPLYYLLLHYWIKINGDTLYNLRLLSALFSAGTIPVIYLIGKRISGVLVGLMAALIFALSPFNIRFAHETRMYTLLAFNAAVAIYALVRLLTDERSARPIGSQFREYLHAWRTAGPVEPSAEGEFSYKTATRNQTGWRAWIFRHRWLPIQAIETDLAWVVFIVFSVATMLSHNTAILFPLAANIFVLGLILFQRVKKSESLAAFQAPSFWNWVKAQIAILVLWSPWIFGFVKQASKVYQEFWIPKPGWDTIVQAFGSLLNAPPPGAASQGVIIWILFALVLCLGLVYYAKKFSRFLLLAALFAIPFLGELLVSIRRPIFFDRTLIWATIPLILVIAAGIMQFRYRLLIIAALGIVGTINLFTAGDYFRSSQKEEWDNVAGFVANFVQKDDLILFNTTGVQIPFDYYFIPYEELYFLKVVKHGVPVDMFDSGVREPKMTESDIPRLLSLLSGHKRVWLVYSHNLNTDPLGLIPQTIATEMKLVYTRDFYEAQVQIYIAP